MIPAKLFLLAAIAWLPCFVCAQSASENGLTDSLQRVLAAATNDTAKIKILYSLSRDFADTDSALALRYAGECLRLSAIHKWQEGTGLAYRAFGAAYYELSRYGMAMQYDMKARDIFTSISDSSSLAKTLIGIGNDYQGVGLYTQSIENYLAALPIFEALHSQIGISAVYNDMGIDYYNLLEYDKAIDNYKQSLATDRLLKDTFGLASDLDNIAVVYIDEHKYDSADAYNRHALPLFEAANDPAALGRIYINRGNILLHLHDARAAYEWYSRSLAINRKLGITIEVASCNRAFGNLYLQLATDTAAAYTVAPFMRMSRQQRLDSARHYLLGAYQLGKTSNDFSRMMEYTSLLSQTEEQLGNYKPALAYYKDFTGYKDSIYNDENKRKVAALEMQRLAEVKDAQIKLLNQQKALEASEVKRQTWIRNTIILLAVFLAALTYIFLLLYNRRKKIKFDNQVKEVEMKALRAQMNPHFIFNSLHSINRYVIENDKDNASSYLSKFANLMRLILDNSREPEVPLEKDLNALELYMQLEALRFKNRFTYSIHTGEDIDKENVLIPPMMLQPFVENAILHGIQGKENGVITIDIQKQGDMICCVVEDNGKGNTSVITTAVKEGKTHTSLGKKIISERLQIINQVKKTNASVTILTLQDALNKPVGLRVELMLPLEFAF